MEKPQVYISHYPQESAATTDHIRKIFQLHNYPVANTSQDIADNQQFTNNNHQLSQKENYTVVLLSTGYLHSSGCLSELLAVLEQYPVHHRVYLIMQPGASLETMDERQRLRRYWQEKWEAHWQIWSASDPDSITRMQKYWS